MKSAGLRSWGHYPQVPQVPTTCYWRSDLPQVLAQARKAHGTTLAYGAGMSYGDSCLAASDHVLLMRPLDRFIAADWQTGVLTVEAGVTLEMVLEQAIPRGWFLPVAPGTQHITIGGAIANDVHGKNHHRRGTFGRFVRQFGLVRSDKGRIICSATQQTELFHATIGGLGLTGLIDWAEIQLAPIRSSRVDVVTHRFGNLEECFALSDDLDARHEFSVAWVDATGKGRTTGRGVYMAGDFADHGPLGVEKGAALTVPVTAPLSLVNPLSLRAFNTFCWRRAPSVMVSKEMGYQPFFFPLDRILDWNRLYGPKGFQQYHALIPARDAREGVRALLTTIAASGCGASLAVLKRCGDIPSPGLLSFPMPGMTLALDFPQAERLTANLFPRLDALVHELNGRLYPAKDAHLSGRDFRRSYPAWRQIETLRDPALCSRFWRRVTQ